MLLETTEVGVWSETQIGTAPLDAAERGESEESRLVYDRGEGEGTHSRARTQAFDSIRCDGRAGRPRRSRSEVRAEIIASLPRFRRLLKRDNVSLSGRGRPLRPR